MIFLSIQPFLRPLFSGQQELSKLDYYFQNGGKTGAQTNQGFCKLNNIFWWSKISHIIIKGWNYMIKSFSGQVVFCFAILRAISAYVGENWLSQYMTVLTLVIPLNLSFSCQNHENLLNYTVLDLIQTEIRCLFTFSRFVHIR